MNQTLPISFPAINILYFSHRSVTKWRTNWNSSISLDHFSTALPTWSQNTWSLTRMAVGVGNRLIKTRHFGFLRRSCVYANSVRLISESCCHLVARPSSLCAGAAIFLFFRPTKYLNVPSLFSSSYDVVLSAGVVQRTGSFHEKAKNTASAVIISGL